MPTQIQKRFYPGRPAKVNKQSIAVVGAIALLTACTRPNPAIDPQLSGEIAKIRAIDNHAHPVRPTGAGEKPDDEYDALPVDNLEPQSDPVRLRSGSPQILDARRQLFHDNKPGVTRAHSGDYATWVLDQLGIETMLSNRVAMGPGLPAPRFRWVAFADALMYPLDNQPLIHNSDQKAFFTLEERLLRRYYSESGVTAKPATLDQYLEKVVRATLQRHKDAGALAEKFEMAYLRTLDVDNPSRADAASVYAKGSGDYKALQDYIFRFIASECGRLGMAVHIHAAHGGGGYFNVAGANPLLLEPLLDDPFLRQTNFVLLHGGWPFTREIAPLLTKPNMYVDFSEQTISNYPRAVSEVIRSWIEYVPEKVMFATDAYPYSPEMGWEESGWIATTTGREALALALTGMLNDNEISRDRALELARMVLRENARKLYRLP
jgi:hypothetical protein